MLLTLLNYKKNLGWKPSLQFEEGLSKTVDWYLQNEEWLNNVTSGAYANYYQKQYQLDYRNEIKEFRFKSPYKNLKSHTLKFKSKWFLAVLLF
jgi:hypothetical protein